ncbi:hypothetical protein EPO66_04585 [bacterium]|nr:MAG: hypothetical protein EPO66_04585 [bacterium]
MFILLVSTFLTNVFAAYEEINTTQGKVIRGISKAQALKKFGPPSSVSENLWQYSGQENFFVYFTDPVMVYLYPNSCSGQLGVPVEFKVFADSADYKIRDVTEVSEFLVDDPANFVSIKPGFFIAKKPGRYQVLARFRKSNVRTFISNPAYVDVPDEKSDKKEDEEEKIVAINIVPFKPVLPVKTRLGFSAFATFFNNKQAKYDVREITRQAEWFIKSEGAQEKRLDGSQIYFSSVGNFQVFCKYQNIKSYPQDVTIQDYTGTLRKTLKHIMVLPEFVTIPKGSDVSFIALGTYYNNEVQDITAVSEWATKDRAILKMEKNGSYFASSVGITEIGVDKDKIESSPVKAVVVNKIGDSDVFNKKEEEKPKNLFDDLLNNINKLNKDTLSGSKDLRQIKLSPDNFKISIGEKSKQIVAMGVYADGSEEDLTLLGDWKSSDGVVAGVIKGLVSPNYPGEAKIEMEYKNVKSLPASVLVEGPKLISIVVTPDNSIISIGGILNLKAEGHFSDLSVKDITTSAGWLLDNVKSLKVEAGKITTFGSGITNISAEYLNIKSLPVRVEVVLTNIWILLMILKFLLFVIVVLVIILSVFYFLVQRNKAKIIALSSSPAEFIIALYSNSRDIFSLSGFKKDLCIAPITYAKMIEDKLLNKSGDLSAFTILYEEAKYSKHVLTKKETLRALGNYNNFLRILLSNYKGLELLKRKTVFLLFQKPFFIEESVCGLGDAKD